MSVKLLKIALVAAVAATAFFYSTTRPAVHANQSGPPASRTGAPGELTCAISGCHDTFALNTGGGSVAITGLPDNYTAGQDYTLTVTVTFAGRTRFGFQATVLDSQNRAVGTIAATDNGTFLQSRDVAGSARRYINHGPTGVNQSSWSFRWTAPATAAGRITVYAAGNATDRMSSDSNDYIYTTSKSAEPMSAPAAVATVSAASYAASAVLPANSIAALFGSNLATGVTQAATNPLPTTLGGVSVKVKDSAGVERDAGLFFVSSQQINLVIPGESANGAATIRVVSGGNTIGQGQAMIDTLAPGLFTAAGTGQGVAAAEVLRVRSNGTLVYEPVARFNTATSAWEGIPIAFGTSGDQLFLVAYGTGFRNNSGLSSASATIGGDNAEVLYASAQNGLVGLDQANIRLLPALAGRGTVNVVLTVGGKATNAVTITMQ
jgi:uncharacterized protein (TIGR03437 family)